MLIEELSGGPADNRVEAGRCPLRGMRKAQVAAPSSNATKYAATMSVVMTRTVLSDHLDDADRAGPTARLAFPYLDRAVRRASVVLPQFGDQLTKLAAYVSREAQGHLTDGGGLDSYLAPVESACGLAYRGISILLDRPETGDALYGIGTSYGKMVALIDALEDFESDCDEGKFNIIAAAWPELSRADQCQAVRAELNQANQRIVESLDALTVPADSVVRHLLVDMLTGRARKALGHFGYSFTVEAPVAVEAPVEAPVAAETPVDQPAAPGDPAAEGAANPTEPLQRHLAGHHHGRRRSRARTAALLPAVLLLNGDCVCVEMNDCGDCDGCDVCASCCG
jgi:hypothetical protein